MNFIGDGSSRCLLCGHAELEFCYREPNAKSVTSDCKVWPEPPVTVSCLQCGHLQKLRNRDSEQSTQAVYAHYDIYHLSEGSEQVIFQNGLAEPQSRSAKIIDRLPSTIRLPDEGSLLDVGCGNGAFLSAFGKRYPRWSLFGFEQNVRYRKHILTLPQVKGFYADTLKNVRRKFDWVSLIHVFEHIPEPDGVLQQIHSLLSDEGHLLIQVPNILKNPFDMVVIDHCSHFSPEVLTRFVLDKGYEVVCVATDWVHKEISLLLQRPKTRPQTPSPWYEGLPIRQLLEDHQAGGNWLRRVGQEAVRDATQFSFGIFGTAIAGTWLAAQVGQRVRFFVDEDKIRVGKLHLGKPVLAPQDLKPKDRVFIAFPFDIAVEIQKRMKGSSPAVFKIPPPLKDSKIPSFTS